MITVRNFEPRDDQLPHYDHTALSAINTCPTWGLIRYVKGLAMPGGGRAMALEAGSACHDAFAAIRLARLWRMQKLHEHADVAGYALFGKERWDEMRSHLKTGEDDETAFVRITVDALHTSGFIDDDRDTRRTIANLEETCIAYVHRLNYKRDSIYVADEDDPQAFVGVEVPVRFVVETPEMSFVYTGRCDGLHVRAIDSELEVQENKTGSRIDEVWVEAMTMTHQTTGYCVGMSLLTGRKVMHVRNLGSAIPMPRNYDLGGVVQESTVRDAEHVQRWLTWVEHTINIIAGCDDPATSPKYTHSCNRYFRPCSMIPYCAAPDDEKTDILDMMVYDKWNPLEAKAGD